MQYGDTQITGVISSVPLYEQCSLSIVLNSNAGSSEPLIITLGKQCISIE